MVQRKYYIGSNGPYFYDDAELVDDPDGDFSGLNQSAFMTDGEVASDNITASETTVAMIADYVMLDDDRVNLILMTTGAADKTITLPTALDNEGRVISIKKIDAGAGRVIIDGEGAETIDGDLAKILAAQYVIITIRSENGEWIIVSEGRGIEGSGVLPSLGVANIVNPVAELGALAGVNGNFVVVYQVIGGNVIDAYTIYAYDDDGPAVNPPYIVAADGAGTKRWIAIAGAYATIPQSFEDLTVIIFRIYDTNLSHSLQIDWDENDIADRILDLLVNGADRIINLSGDIVIGGTLDVDDQLTINCNAVARVIDLSGNVTLAGALDIDDQLTINCGGAARVIGLNGTLNVGGAGSNLNQNLETIDSPTFVTLLLTAPKSGATQAAAGAAANELWKTNAHATLPDNVLMIGV